jgi:hypothetical protein
VSLNKNQRNRRSQESKSLLSYFGFGGRSSDDKNKKQEPELETEEFGTEKINKIASFSLLVDVCLSPQQLYFSRKYILLLRLVS